MTVHCYVCGENFEKASLFLIHVEKDHQDYFIKDAKDLVTCPCHRKEKGWSPAIGQQKPYNLWEQKK